MSNDVDDNGEAPVLGTKRLFDERVLSPVSERLQETVNREP